MWKSLLGDNEEQGESLLSDESGGLCSLSPTQRIYGFAACLIAGLACMLLSLIVFVKPIKFAVLFSFGNLLAVGSTAFLFGPAQQFAMMVDPVRVFATAIFLGCVVIALICALLGVWFAECLYIPGNIVMCMNDSCLWLVELKNISRHNGLPGVWFTESLHE